MSVTSIPKLSHNQKVLTKIAVPLKYLDVNFDVLSGAGIKDDTIMPMICSWNPNIVRIATIGDGSCFIHSVLKACYQRYQILNDAEYRIGLAERVRRDLGLLLNVKDPEHPDLEYWLTIGSGRYPSMLMQELLNDDMINRVDEPELDYSLYGLQRQFNSGSWATEPLIQAFSKIFNFDIYFLYGTTLDLQLHSVIREPGPLRRSLLINYIDQAHYETIGLKVNGKIQTVFEPDDIFLVQLQEHFRITPEENEKDPEELFIEHAVNTFLNRDTLIFNVPESLYEIFDEDDPFRRTFDRLSNDILEAANRRIEYFLADIINNFPL